jgi:hypothetical protein
VRAERMTLAQFAALTNLLKTFKDPDGEPVL